MRRLTLFPIAIFMLVLASLFAGYMGSYYALLEDRHEGWVLVAGEGEQHIVFPTYRAHSRLAAHLLTPAHLVDRRIRSDYWAPTFR